MTSQVRENSSTSREVPTTILSSTESDENMPPGIIAVRILFWMAIKSINILYLPVIATRLFKKSKRCPPIKDQILLLSAAELADRIRNRKISCETVIKAYILRIQEVNPIINAIIEDRFQQALEDAKKVDALLAGGTVNAEELKEKRPLLGVPITIKGSIEVKHMKSTSGMVKRADIIAEEDAVTVRYAREAGAIILLTSNIPELCLNWESTNKLIGTTKNPYDTARTCGGSSGGEASLLATGGSLIGIGSDVGGSLRLPAHFCGIWGHKPSPGVVSNVGHYPSCKHEEIWTANFTLGPMARYAPDLTLLLQVISFPHVRHRLRLNDPVNIKDLRIFYMEEIKNSVTSKLNDECLTALHDVIDALNEVCYVGCEKVDLPLMKYAPELSSIALLDIDDVDNLFTGRGDGSVMELLRYMTFRSNSVFTSIMYGLLRKLSKHVPRSTTDYCTRKLDELRSEILKLLGKDGVLLIPSFTAEAHHHGEIFRKAFDSAYLSIFNALGLPVTNCPVRFTKSGLPVGIQVVGAPYCDRLTLEVANEIEKAFGGWQPPSS